MGHLFQIQNRVFLNSVTKLLILSFAFMEAFIDLLLVCYPLIMLIVEGYGYRGSSINSQIQDKNLFLNSKIYAFNILFVEG